MRTKLFLAAAVAALVSITAGIAATADAGAATRGVLYSFLGRLAAVPDNGHVSITVEGGNRPALRALLGHSVDQTLSYGDATEFLKWSNGVPTVVHASDLDTGDYVWVHVRAPRGSSLATIEETDAGVVGDRGTELNPPSKPLYLFRGRVASVGSGSLTVDVRAGNRRALRLLIGQSSQQTFATGPETIFLLWQGKVPSACPPRIRRTGDERSAPARR